ncbi:MAG: lysylphosphatidylglycerol synthase domain-containing protein [Steroidobacteraceae bacterium]
MGLRLRPAAYLCGLLGLALLIVLVVRADFGAMLHSLDVAGWRLTWLVPYRASYFLLYAVGWGALLRPYNRSRQVGLAYLFWVTSVREAIDRLLPVASVGGGVVGIRLLRWRGLGVVPASVSVILEILLTLAALYAFVAVGLLLLFDFGSVNQRYHHLLLVFLCTLPIPVATALLLRYGSVFSRARRWLRPLVGERVLAESATALDQELRAAMGRGTNMFISGALQWLAMTSAAFEVWLVLRLCGHPIGVAPALILESMTQAARQLAFFVPAGLGVQEAGLVLFGHALGISGELALVVSMAKRLREVLCGLPSLASWQWMEIRHLKVPAA